MTNLIYNVKIVNIFFIVFPFTSYVKLQQAYVSEAAAYGSWKLIGYTAPGDGGVTTNFTFTAVGLLADNASATVATENVWTAKNNTKMNDCVSAANN